MASTWMRAKVAKLKAQQGDYAASQIGRGDNVRPFGEDKPKPFYPAKVWVTPAPLKAEISVAEAYAAYNKPSRSSRMKPGAALRAAWVATPGEFVLIPAGR